MNMFPFFPMDGARVLRAGLTRLVGSYRATKVTGWLSFAMSSLLVYNGLFLFTSHQPGGIMRIAFGLFFAMASRAMTVHPGTVTIDERK
jgi:Zn-dependent protease